MPYTCACCGEVHEELPDMGFDMPAHATAIPEEEWADRVELDTDSCIVDGEDFFIRTVLLIPIHDSDEHLGFGVWVSQKKESFETYMENFYSADIGPFFGWFSNELMFGGQSTLNLKTMAYFQGDGLRPYIELEPTDHPLSVAQSNGISLKEAWNFIHLYIGPKIT